jgi:hypothetical protein
LKKKEDDEFWLFTYPYINYFELYGSKVNHYQVNYPREKYVGYPILSKKQNLEKREENLEKNLIRVKMLCNWCSSETLCKEWSNMCEDPASFTWKNLQMTWTNEKVDYYIIINKPIAGDFYDPKKTIVFQMEPWVNDTSKPWGVKTWGEWAIPEDNKFLAVRGRHTKNCWNNAFWQLELTLNEILNLQSDQIDKKNAVSSICSSKYFDEGHILRIDFLKYIEKRFQETADFVIDIYNSDNEHNFKNYRGPLDPYKSRNKSQGIVPYKYYFMMENNFEENFITEKLWEPILCETLVFYYGCPNVSDYINPLAYVQLDINDFEKSYEIIKQAIDEDWWSQRIDVIREEKKKLLDQMAFFPVIHQVIEQDLVKK